MEELRSTEILDKEIQEDARKKADKIVKNSQIEAQNILDSVDGRIEVARQEKEKFYAEKLTRFERDTNASLPLEKQRLFLVPEVIKDLTLFCRAQQEYAIMHSSIVHD